MKRTINGGLDTTREFKGKREIYSVDLMIKCNSLSKNLLIIKKTLHDDWKFFKDRIKNKNPLKKFKKDPKHYQKDPNITQGLYFDFWGPFCHFFRGFLF
jgi:hypothetical protein